MQILAIALLTGRMILQPINMFDVGGYCEEGSPKESYCGCASNLAYVTGYALIRVDGENEYVNFDEPMEAPLNDSDEPYITCHQIMGYGTGPGEHVVASEILRNVDVVVVRGYR